MVWRIKPTTLEVPNSRLAIALRSTLDGVLSMTVSAGEFGVARVGFTRLKVSCHKQPIHILCVEQSMGKEMFCGEQRLRCSNEKM